MLKEMLKNISESPVYLKGNWENNKIDSDIEAEYIEDYKIIFNKKLRIDGKNRDMFAMIDEDYTNLLFGYFYINNNIKMFKQIGQADIQRVKFIENLKKDYKPLYELTSFYILKGYRRRGFGTIIFGFLFNMLGFNIMSNDKIFSGMKIIFDRFSSWTKCDIIDIKTNEIIYENYKIDYKKDNVDFIDKNIYSLDLDKKDIRIVLYK